MHGRSQLRARWSASPLPCHERDGGESGASEAVECVERVEAERGLDPRRQDAPMAADTAIGASAALAMASGRSATFTGGAIAGTIAISSTSSIDART